jgi:hypothetical protein
MTIRNKVITCFIAVLFLASMGAWAGSQNKGSTPANPKMSATPAKTPMTHTTQGTISSIDDNQLVIKHKGKDVKFVLNAETQRQGNLAAGSQVTVNYREENKQNIATAVRETPAKQASSSKKK